MDPLRLPFVKVNGTKNDFCLFFNVEVATPGAWEELAAKLCDRSVLGADGLLVVDTTHCARCKTHTHNNVAASLRIFNADGSQPEMCGNGLRTVASFLHDQSSTLGKEFRVCTGRGLLLVTLVSSRMVTVNMGCPAPLCRTPAVSTIRAEQLDVPLGTLSEDSQTSLLALLGLGGTSKAYPSSVALSVVCVSMGNPHCVVFLNRQQALLADKSQQSNVHLPPGTDEKSPSDVLVKSLQAFPVKAVGAVIERLEARFPDRVNVEFVMVESASKAHQRTWERGCGETNSCGTGASAVAVAGISLGLFEKKVDVHLTGGVLTLQWSGRLQDDVLMTGPTQHEYTGTVRVPRDAQGQPDYARCSVDAVRTRVDTSGLS